MGCQSIAGLSPALNSLVPICTPGWREALWELSVLPKNTTQCPRPGLEPGLLDPEMSALTMRPPRLPITRESVPFSLKVVEETLVFICTWIFCVCRLHNINCHNYGHNVLQDCSLQNAEKSKLSVYMLFNCNSSLLNGHVKHCQGNYVIWHTCPADNWKKWIWNPGL